MKNQFLILMFALIVAPIAIAKTKTADFATVEKANAGLQSWSAEFEQITTIELLGEKLSKHGKIVAAKPDKFQIHYASEPVKTYYYNGKNLWIHQHKTQSVIQYKKPEQWISEEALSFLSGMDELSKHFTDIPLLEAPDFAFKDKSLQALALVPLQNNDSIMYLILGVDANHLTKEAFIWTPSGNESHYIFSNIQKNQKLDSSLFSWTKTKGVKLIKK